jgi:NAD(P)-dependent dehydrogenase (short-subunit alcohol dehydrogenase family)
MAKSHEGKVAVITGAASGIGQAFAKRLAEDGVAIVIADRQLATDTVALVQATGSRVLAVPCDVSSERDVAALAQQVDKAFGRCDILVNNAGIMADPRGSRVLDSKPATWRATLDTNLLGPLLMIQALVPLMKKNGYGRIVNVSSGQGQLTDMGVGTPAYRVSKTALNALTRTTAAELKGSGILANAMCPGWVRTDMGGSGAPRSVEQGADTALWLATLPDDGPSGGYFRDRKPIPW